jgi:type I restriction enzyme M protein
MVDAAAYKHIALGLMFLKYISDTFQARRDELSTRFLDKTATTFWATTTRNWELLASELEDHLSFF